MAESVKIFDTTDDVKFTESNRSKPLKILAVVIVLLIILVVIFLALFVNERNRYNDCKAKSNGDISQGNGTIAPTKILTTVLPTSGPKNNTGLGPWTNLRLPSFFKPHHYELELLVDLKMLLFSGNVIINVTLSQETPYMYLHTNKLNISASKLKKDGNEIKIKRQFWYEKNQFYVMEAKQNLTSGIYFIEMEFIGKLDNDLVGLYRSTYKNQNNTEITIAATQFQPTDARKVFPCFDEPALKATFNVTMVRPKNMISISSMPQIRSEPRGDNMVADYYENTVIMPTYLLAFIVCDFVKMTNYAGRQAKTSMSYYATRGQLEQVKYAMDIGGKLLDHFEKYFNISYPLPKADMIAIPDFEAGAMENWGLIIYRETVMLFKEGYSSEKNKEGIAKTIAHELGHMWFGNLVSPLWWDDLWLNEGFATYLEYVGVEGIHPEWNLDEMFVNYDMSSAFELDALVTSHPILLEVNYPDEINQIFDPITYKKGSTIIRMLQHFLTEEIFKNGLINYLNAHKYGNAKTKDLWDYLTMASKAAGKYIDVAEVMDTWTLQMGYPVVSVSEVGGDIILTQQRFLADPNANQSNTKFTSKYGYKWHIPFTIAISKKGENSEVETNGLEIVWMNRTSDRIIVPNIQWDPSTQWVKGNVGQTGFYRVNYPEKNWELLAEQLQRNSSVLSPGDKAGLLRDAFALANAGLLRFKYALNLTRYLKKETNFISWDAGYSSLSSLKDTLPKSGKIHNGLSNYLFQLIKPNFEKLGFHENGTHLDKFLRIDGINAACGVGDEHCMKKTKDLFDKWIKNESYPVPADLRSPVYLYGISQSGVKEWDITFERMQRTNIASDRRNLMYGLAGTREPWILNRYLQYAIDDTKVRNQDTSGVISDIANANPVGRSLAWNFLKEVWPIIIEKFGGGFDFSVIEMLNGVASAFSTQWELEELENFFGKYPQSGSATLSREQLLEKVRANIQWRAKYEKPIEDWLDAL
ncbi:glutamyl aminopeptidase-like [Dendronephthya gigantea]|uniref:glutamyl aminopeptidase-like n=1 Tax=Dendronephthya gigantea TaxID=151771 RepID=UPI00106B08BE|nr:glutamyl aminopeptidase-like [Dendronephthya gigantea]